MRFLFTTQPGHGHFFPLVPLAQGLIAAGHEVRVACAPSFLPRVERAGLPGVAAGLDWLESAPEQSFPEMAGLPPSEQEAMLVDIFVGTSAQHMAADLLDLCEAWRPDLIVRDAFEYGGCVVGEALGIPHLPVDMELYIPPHISQDGMKEELAYLRSSLGLPPHPAMAMLTRHGYLSSVPPSYQVPDYRLPEGAFTVRPTFPRGSSDDLPAWIHDLPDQPTVYATMGTTYNKVPMIIRMFIEALADEPLNLIITIGPGQDPAQYGSLPPNVHVEPFILQAALMPHCDLVIANGGVGTVMIALDAGVPLLVIPVSGILLLHAQRCRALGLGCSLKLPEGLYPPPAPEQAERFVARQALALAYDDAPPLSVETLRATVREMLATSAYREAARRMQREIESLPEAAQAVARLEEAARRG